MPRGATQCRSGRREGRPRVSCRHADTGSAQVDAVQGRGYEAPNDTSVPRGLKRSLRRLQVASRPSP